MTEEQRKQYATAFAVWFKGNLDAIQLCLDVLDVAHVWDDLIDQDVAVDPEEIDDAFCKAMFNIPLNKFWQDHCKVLVPTMVNIWTQWRAANVLEATGAKIDRDKAYMLRAGLYQLFVTCATLIGGRDWCIEVAPMVWRFYGEELPDA